MREIQMQIIGYEVKKTSGCAGTQGEGNATSLLISFGEDWDGMAKKLTWINALGQDPVVRTLTADLLVDLADNTRLYRTVIPPEPLAYAGECTMVVDGYTDGVRARSVAVRLLVKHAPIVPSDPTDPTPTQAEQLQAQIDTLLEDMSEQAGIAQAGAATATQKAAEATASAATAASSAQGAEKSAAAAASSANAAGNSAAAASASAAAAGNSETAAKTSENNAKASETAAAASASSASTSAQTAAAKAGEASASGLSAAQSAQTAHTAASAATSAQSAAVTAKTGAETARDQAQTACATATAKAGEARQSADAAVDAAEAISAYGTSVDVVLTAAGMDRRGRLLHPDGGCGGAPGGQLWGDRADTGGHGRTAGGGTGGPPLHPESDGRGRDPDCRRGQAHRGPPVHGQLRRGGDTGRRIAGPARGDGRAGAGQEWRSCGLGGPIRRGNPFLGDIYVCRRRVQRG